MNARLLALIDRAPVLGHIALAAYEMWLVVSGRPVGRKPPNPPTIPAGEAKRRSHAVIYDGAGKREL